MSEKRVNIKITASTSDFDKAIKKAQKQIKELTDTIADINKDKFGDELEKQFKNITESAEKAQEQLKDIKDSLDDIDKIKLDKLDKQFKDMADSVEKFNDKLKDTKDGVEDTTKEVKDLNKEISDVDNTKVEKLTDSFKDMDTHIDDATDSMKKLNNETNDFGDNASINKFGENIKDIKQDTDNLAESFNNINDNLSDVDASGFKKIVNMTDNIKDVFSGDNTIKFDTNGNSLLDTVVEGFTSGTIAGNKLSDAMEEVAQNINQITDSMKEMSEAATPQEIAKQYNDLINDLIKVQEEYDKAAKEKAKFEEELEEKENDKYGWEQIKRIDTDKKDKAIEEYRKATEALKDYQEQIKKLNELEENHNKKQADMDNVSEALEKQRKVVQDLEQEYIDCEEALGKFDGSDFNKTIEGTNKTLKELSNNAEKAEKNIADLFGFIQKYESTMDKAFLIGDKNNLLSDGFKKAYEEYKNFMSKINSGELNFSDEIKEFERLTDNMSKSDILPGGIVKEFFSEATESMKKCTEAYRSWEDVLKRVNSECEKNKNIIDTVTESQEEYNKALEKRNSYLDKFNQATINEGDLEKELKEKRKALEQAAKELEDYKNKLGDISKEEKILTDSVERTKKAAMEAADEWAQTSNDYDEARRNAYLVGQEIEKLRANMESLNETLAKGDKKAEESAKALNEKLKAYEALSKKVKAYLEDESNAIILREKVAKSFKEVSEAMEKVYSGSSKFNNADLIKQTLEDAKKYIKELDVVSTENIQADLDRLGKIIEDKTEKIKRFKEANKEFGTEAGKNAYGLEKQAESLKEYADSTAFVIEATDTLKKAWGDISIGDEDHLKIRAREELLDGYVEKLKKAAYGIKKHYSEAFGPITAKEQDKLNDWEVWEKNAEKLKEYNRAIEEYFTTLLDNKGKIDDKFLTDGKFDVDKFIKDFDKMGTSTMVLSKQINAVRTELLENIKAQKEAAQYAVENAKAAKEQAEAAVKNAKTAEEEAEAKERLKKAEQELKEAKEKSNKVDKERIEEAKELIKAYNKQAEALRKLGIAVEDINKADISKFDKSLGSILDGMDTFSDGNKIKSFGDFFEDIKGVFASFNSFDLGDLAGGLGDVFGNVLDLIPGKVKLVIAAITALIAALNKLYESGKQQFFEGLEKGFAFISKLGDIARDVGQEVKDAFEDITGTQLDWSSLMALGPEFEYQMAKVGAIAGSNEQQLERLIAKAKELGGTTQYKASEVGEAFEYMAMAGYDTEEMLSSINGTLALSIASGTDLASTTDIVTDYMTALGLEANSTNDFVDKLAATITSSNTTVEKWGQSMKNVASQAGALGIGMTDLSTAIGLMANAGVKGSKAGTALKNVLANMAAPTKKQAAALKKLGFEADKETGSYLITDDDGNVDLDATMKQLMEATKDMEKTEKAALLTAIAGKEALPGLMALMSQGIEGWDELSDTIENSTGKVQFWNECMSLAGKSGKDAVAAIDNMKKVFDEVESEGLDAGLSVEELSHGIAILGDDGKITANDVKDLINVIDSMNTSTGEAEEKWRALDKAGDDLINTSYDYDATVAKLMADTSGLSQKTKEAIKDKLKEAKTYAEANKILEEYGLTAERTSFANETYANKLQYLRDNLKGLSDEQIKTELTNLGLADSFDEVLEVVRMSDEEFKQYKDNLESVKGMAESLSEAMDETTKAGLLELASAIENVAIAAFDKFEPAINDAVKALNDFFTTWHNGEANNFTFEGFEQAVSDISDKIVNAAPQIKQAIIDLFNTIKEIVTVDGGVLDSVLDAGTSIIQNICDGILESEDTLDETIDSFIKKMCAWIQENGPKVEEAGKMLLDAITEGIENNEGIISDAMNTICDIITTWTNSSGELKAAAGLFAEQFVALALENMWIGAKNWLKEKLTAFAELFTGPFDIFGTGGAVGLGMNLWSNIMEGLFGSDPIGEAMEWLTDKLGNFNLLEFIFDLICKPFSGVFKAAELFGDWNPIEDIKGWFNDKVGDWSFIQWAKDKLTGKDDSKDSKKSNKKTTKKLDQVDVETLVNIDTAELSEVENALVKLQKTAQEAANTIRTEFVNMTNIARNQMLNISNIIRNQAINWANIIRNQAKNARDGFTQQMLSMASVARTQLVNISNIIRNQSLSWYNVINNQAKNARDAFTRQMMSMVAVARNQMYNVLSTVRSYMSQITGATNKSISLNVGQSGGSATLPTTPALAMADALYAANAASTYSLDASGISSRASSASSNNSSASYGPSEANIIHTHVYLEGREIAKASAKYMNNEIKAINKRENRKRGVK